MSRSEALIAAGLLLVGLSVYAPIAWNDALPIARHSDVNFATQNARGFIDGLSEGRFYPRWLAEVNHGHGAPTFLYYSPAAYYAVGAVNLLTPDLLTALRATGVLLGLLSGVTFLLAARRWASNRAAALAAALYVALPYHVLDLYERFAFAEFAAFVWYPLVFACADRLLDGPSRRAWLGFASSYAALVLTHLVSGFMLPFVLVPYLGFRVVQERCWLRVVPLATAAALGLACCTVLLLPVVFERGLIQFEHATEMGRFNWKRNLLFRDEVAAGYSRATVKPVVERAAVGQAVLALGAVGTLAWRRRRRAGAGSDAIRDRSTTLAWIATAAWTFALQTTATWPVWAIVPELETVQFPWRFGGFQALAGAVLVARALTPAERTGSAWPELPGLPCALGALFALWIAVGMAANAQFLFDHEQADAPNARGNPSYWVIPRGIADRLAIADEAPRLAPHAQLQAEGTIEIGEWRPHERRLVYQSTADGALRIRTFAFPGWVAEIDGKPIAIEAAGRWGSIQIQAPAGRHEVRIAFDETPIRRIGAITSALAVASLLIAAAWGRGRPTGRRLMSSSLLLAALGCGTPELPTARNLVVLTLDTVRRDHLSVYGYTQPTTPRLEAFADESVVFWNAIAQDTNTNPSHASMFTGQYPHVHGNRANGQILRPGVATLASILRDEGFTTAGFISSAVLESAGSGLDRGFEVYDDAFPGRRRTGAHTVERARRWLAAQPDEGRHLLFVHLYDAHGPYRPPAVHAQRFRSPSVQERLPRVPRHMRLVDEHDRPFSRLGQYVDQYDATLRHLDDLFEQLRRAIDLEDTAVIVLADHGETLGERYHGLDHGGQVFDEQIRIPLLVYAPRLAPRRVDELVQTVDLLPTALDLLGIAPPAAHSIQGHSLAPLLLGDEARGAPAPAFSAARAVAARHGDRGYVLDRSRRIQSVRSQNWKLIRYPGAQDDYLELYDLKADPGEKHDLAAHAPRRLAEYTALLEAWSATDAAGDDTQDPVLRDQLRELGYVE